MNMTSLILAAIAGAVAALLARLLKDPKEDKQAYGITFAVIFAALYFTSRFTVLPWWEVRQVEAKLLETPAFKAIKTYDPEGYDKLMDELRTAVKEHRTQEQVVVMFRDYGMKLVLKKLPTSSN